MFQKYKTIFYLIFFQQMEKFNATTNNLTTWLFTGKMIDLEGEATLVGHSYFSKPMANFKMSYTYRNYVEPVLQDANDMAARNGRNVAGKGLALAAAILIFSHILCR